MDLGTLIGAIVGVLGFGATVAGAFVGYGKLNGKAEASASDIVDLKSEINEVKDEFKDELKSVRAMATDAQKSAQAVDGLAKAVEHMGQQLTSEIKHVISTFAIETGHTRSQLADIKEELRSVRSAKARAAKAGDDS